MDYGSKIRQIRLEKGLIQDDVADRLGIGQGAYSDWELGKTDIKLDAVPKLAKAFNMELSEILQRLFSENMVFNNHDQKGGNAANIIINNVASEKVMELIDVVIAKFKS